MCVKFHIVSYYFPISELATLHPFPRPLNLPYLGICHRFFFLVSRIILKSLDQYSALKFYSDRVGTVMNPALPHTNHNRPIIIHLSFLKETQQTSPLRRGCYLFLGFKG